MIEIDTRLRLARGIAKTETKASITVFETLKRRGHPEAPPAVVSDGWGGIKQAMIAVYGQVLQGASAHEKARSRRLAVSSGGQIARYARSVPRHRAARHIR